VDKETKGKVKNFFLDMFFPAFCLGCGKEGSYVCPDCKELLDILQNQYCLCAKNPTLLPAEELRGKCHKCSGRRLSGIYFALSYKEKPLTRKLIHLLKYEPYYLKDLARPIANIMLDHLALIEISGETFKGRLIVPVPIDGKKIRRRGYNQSEEIAKELSKQLGIPLVLNNLLKARTTQPQVELLGNERESNLKDAFITKNPAEIKDKKILLIDDVYTTGSTMEECTKVLRGAGAKEVWGLVIARD